MHTATDATPSTLVLVDVGQVLDDLAELDPEDLVELIWERRSGAPLRKAG